MSIDLSIGTDVKSGGDVVGGGSFVWESGIYNTIIDMMYLGVSTNGATSVNLVLKNENGGELKNALWVKSGDSKGNKAYYEKDGVRHMLPGMAIANDLAELILDKPLGDCDLKEKIIKLYDYDASAEVNTPVEVFTEFLGKPIKIAILKEIVDKNTFNEKTKKWEASGETREQNEIRKVFRANDNMTNSEVKAGNTEAKFFDQWNEKWEDVIVNKAKGAAAGSNGSAGAPGAASGAKKLFS